ncbi:hypothetical protein JRQ81_009145 [Phrynocephalus forsythii]|uniref:Leucine-rich repeat-containing protein 71 n=1 Tax=Phrynocephalus forsythii TaxID=171643 RepID=A0A9Q1AS12_9SAUR|nr:hypothetical protein JRQ81_009145 [Phrynocephalus forsythii]
MGKKGERGARDKAAALEEEARNAARKAEQGEEEYQCGGILEQDFAELCARAGFQEIPRVVTRPHGGHPAAALPEESDPPVEPSLLAQIQSKYSYFRPALQVELEHEDPKSAREVFIRGWKVEEKMLSVLAKCLPALSHLQGLHFWKAGLTDLTFASLLALLPTCTNLRGCSPPPPPPPPPPCRTLAVEGNPLPERSFYKLISEDSTLAHLCLRNNEIDDEAAGLMGQALAALRSSHKGLVSINLSCNHITDVGATHLANALRLNRSLLSLSLASNRIGDEGALKLAEVLGPFALTHTEVVERRRLLLEKESQERGRLPQRQPDVKSERPSSHVSNTAIDKLQPAKVTKALNKKKEKELAKKEEKEKALMSMVQAATVAQAKKEEAKQGKKAVPPAEQKPVRGKGTKSGPKDKRVQVQEVEVTEPTETVNPLLEPAEHRDGKVFLPGNQVLLYLNLLRNQITEVGLKAFLAVVEHQISRVPPPGGKGPTGLLRLSLGKNNYPADSKTFARIQELMALRDPLPKAGARPLEEEQAASGT